MPGKSVHSWDEKKLASSVLVNITTYQPSRFFLMAMLLFLQMGHFLTGSLKYPSSAGKTYDVTITSYDITS